MPNAAAAHVRGLVKGLESLGYSVDQVIEAFQHEIKNLKDKNEK